MHLEFPLHNTWKQAVSLTCFGCKSTCCHDNSCQDFPSCMGGGKVVCELTEFIHHQARDGISQNLKSHTGVYTCAHTKKKTHGDRQRQSWCQTCQLHLLLFSQGTQCTCQRACFNKWSTADPLRSSLQAEKTFSTKHESYGTFSHLTGDHK